MEEKNSNQRIEIGAKNPGEKYELTIPLNVNEKIVSVSRSGNENYKCFSFHVELVFNTEYKYAYGLKIKFLCYIPNKQCCEYFNFLTHERSIIQYTLTGETKAPHIICRRNKLFYHCVGLARTIKKTIELRNLSDTPGDFHIDNNLCESPITIIPMVGVVLPEDKITLIIEFTPKKLGFIYMKVDCLIKFHPPIQIEIFGAWTRADLKSEITQYIKPNEPLQHYKNKYELYMQDCIPVSAQSITPIVSIDRTYIDFGQVSTSQNSDGSAEFSALSKNFSVTNNSQINLKIIWSQEAMKTYKIHPAVSLIQPSCTQKFAAIFIPTDSNFVEAAEIRATIAWGSNSEFITPFPLIVHFLGNTFKEDSCGWDPHYSLQPAEVWMPSTIPNIPSYTTFTIKRENHLPLMFKFIPPPNTYYHLKPMQGVIRNIYQIIIVRLLPTVSVGTNYTENWNLKLNNSKVIKIKLSGIAELPSLIIGNKLWIDLPVINPNSEKIFYVPIRNPTNHTIRYTIKKKHVMQIKTDQWHGVLWPGEKMNKALTFSPKYEGTYTETLCFLACCSTDKVDYQTEILALFKGISTTVYLKVNPAMLDLGDVISNDWAYGNFVIYNSTNCEAYLSAECSPVGIDADPTIENYIKPSSFTLLPNEKVEVEFGVRPKALGLQILHILYHLHKSKDTNELIKGGNKLVEVSLYCTFPQIQILDIRSFPKGHCLKLSKSFYWRTMNIDKLNKGFKALRPDVELNLFSQIFNAEVGSPPVILQFLLQNKTQVKTKLSIKYVKSCICKPVEKSIGVSIRKWVLPCLHHKEVMFEPHVVTLQANEKTIIEMNIVYNTLDCSLFKFIITVQVEEKPNLIGKISLFIKRDSFEHISSGITNNPVDTEIWNIYFSPVRIGNLDSVTQVSWIYSNLRRPVHFELKGLSSDVFHCPIITGSIEPHSIFPLLISFSPNLLQYYKTDATLVLGEKTFRVIMSGYGTSREEITNLFMADKMPTAPLFPKPKSIVQSSTDHLNIWTMPTHSKTERVLFLKNTTEDTIFYEWDGLNVEGIMNIKITPSNGYLSGEEIKPCLIEFHSLGKSSHIACPLFCDVINFSKHLKGQKMRELQHKVATVFDSCFTITEKMFSVPDCVVPRCEDVEGQQLVIGTNVYIHNISSVEHICPKLKEQLSFLTSFKILDKLRSNDEISYHGSTYIIDVLTRSVWSLLSSQWFKTCIVLDLPQTHYNDILQKNARAERAPSRYKEDLLSSILLALVLELFSLNK